MLTGGPSQFTNRRPCEPSQPGQMSCGAGDAALRVSGHLYSDALQEVLHGAALQRFPCLFVHGDPGRFQHPPGRYSSFKSAPSLRVHGVSPAVRPQPWL